MATLDQDLKDLIDNAAEQQSLGAKSDRTATYQVAQLLSSLGIQDIGNNIDDSLGTVATKLDTINATLTNLGTKLDTINTTLAAANTKLDTANSNLTTLGTKMDTMATNQTATNTKLDTANTTLSTIATNTTPTPTA